MVDHYGFDLQIALAAYKRAYHYPHARRRGKVEISSAYLDRDMRGVPEFEGSCRGGWRQIHSISLSGPITASTAQHLGEMSMNVAFQTIVYTVFPILNTTLGLKTISAQEPPPPSI
jgi:hypothetical protein